MEPNAENSPRKNISEFSQSPRKPLSKIDSNISFLSPNVSKKLNELKATENVSPPSSQSQFTGSAFISHSASKASSFQYIVPLFKVGKSISANKLNVKSSSENEEQQKYAVPFNTFFKNDSCSTSQIARFYTPCKLTIPHNDVLKSKSASKCPSSNFFAFDVPDKKVESTDSSSQNKSFELGRNNAQTLSSEIKAEILSSVKDSTHKNVNSSQLCSNSSEPVENVSQMLCANSNDSEKCYNNPEKIKKDDIAIEKCEKNLIEECALKTDTIGMPPPILLIEASNFHEPQKNSPPFHIQQVQIAENFLTPDVSKFNSAPNSISEKGNQLTTPDNVLNCLNPENNPKASQSTQKTPCVLYNPFLKCPELLCYPIVSPNLFKDVVSPSEQEEETFQWAIGQIAELHPVDIRTTPFSRTNIPVDPEYEKKAKEATDKFFSSSNLIVPSPWTNTSNSLDPGSVFSGISNSKVSSPAFKKDNLNEKNLGIKSYTVWSQTELTLPPILPKEIEEALAPFCTFNQSQNDQNSQVQEESQENITANDTSVLNSTSLRRKLFCDEPSIPIPSNDRLSPLHDNSSLADLESSPSSGANLFGEDENGVSWGTSMIRPGSRVSISQSPMHNSVTGEMFASLNEKSGSPDGNMFELHKFSFSASPIVCASPREFRTIKTPPSDGKESTPTDKSALASPAISPILGEASFENNLKTPSPNSSSKPPQIFSPSKNEKRLSLNWNSLNEDEIISISGVQSSKNQCIPSPNNTSAQYIGETPKRFNRNEKGTQSNYAYYIQPENTSGELKNDKQSSEIIQVPGPMITSSPMKVIRSNCQSKSENMCSTAIIVHISSPSPISGVQLVSSTSLVPLISPSIVETHFTSPQTTGTLTSPANLVQFTSPASIDDLSPHPFVQFSTDVSKQKAKQYTPDLNNSCVRRKKTSPYFSSSPIKEQTNSSDHSFLSSPRLSKTEFKEVTQKLSESPCVSPIPWRADGSCVSPSREDIHSPDSSLVENSEFGGCGGNSNPSNSISEAQNYSIMKRSLSPIREESSDSNDNWQHRKALSVGNLETRSLQNQMKTDGAQFLQEDSFMEDQSNSHDTGYHTGVSQTTIANQSVVSRCKKAKQSTCFNNST